MLIESTYPARRLAVRVLGVCAIAVSVVACTDTGSAPRPVLDLVEHVETAQTMVETSLIDVGTPRGRDHLLAGWSPADEKWAGTASFVWGLGVGSSLQFWLFERKESVTLTFRCRPLTIPGRGIVESVAVWFNGIQIDPLDITPGFHEYRLALPPDLQLLGANTLEIDYKDRPENVTRFAGSGTDQTNRIAWDWLRVEEGRGSLMPRAEAGGQDPALLLPHFSSITFELTLGRDSWLEIRSIGSFGPAWLNESGFLRITVTQVDGTAAAETMVIADDEFGAALRWALPAPGAVRIRFESLLEQPSLGALELANRGITETDAGIMLIRPRVLGGQRLRSEDLH